MHKNKIDRFLDGELEVNTIREKESEFTDAYKKVIAKATVQNHDFNPLKKVEAAQKRRFLSTKRILTYAASVLVVMSLFWLLPKSQSEKTEITLSQKELIEAQNNTEVALLQFSKELNNCMSTFNNAMKISEPTAHAQTLKNIEINRSNPLKNIKLN